MFMACLPSTIDDCLLGQCATRTAARAFAGCRVLRLMISGSPLCPCKRWTAGGNQRPLLLERYGMTEIGMRCSIRCTRNEGLDRGNTAAGMDVRLVESGPAVTPGTPGEIEVRDPRVLSTGAVRRDAQRVRDGWSALATLLWWKTALTASGDAPAWISSRPRLQGVCARYRGNAPPHRRSQSAPWSVA